VEGRLRLNGKVTAVGWIEDRWHELTNAGWSIWLVIGVWAVVIVGLAALIYVHRQLKLNREQRLTETRPHVAVFMEPNASDWHVIELVARNFGETAAYDVQFSWVNPPTVGQYESEHDGMVNVGELTLPSTISALAPGQEWRTIWDSTLSRAELGQSIDWRFVGAVKYADLPAAPDGKRRAVKGRHEYQTKVVLDWDDLQPVQRVELMTGHELAKRERNKLELLRNLLTYFHYASQETRAEVYQSEIDGVRRATDAVKERLRSRQLEDPTDVGMRPFSPDAEYEAKPNGGGKHHNEHV
jgi:hypothetical protein